ncbi:MAG: helix-turn-helix domain-containing protein [Sporomusaceae bacterium]|nr:helix-turn-helix domain-containing protein [Sporomusaceae bacterium]
MKTITEKDILSAQQVADMLQVSDDTIYELVRQNKIPFKRVGKQLRFVGYQIIEWLENGEKGA